MKPTINMLRLDGWSITRQLRLEEALFRHDSRNWCIVNWLDGPSTVVLGINGKEKKLVNLDLVRQDSVPVIRRFSGGGTVVVGRGTMVASIVSKKNDAPCDPYPRSIMDWTGGLYASVFDRMGEPNVRLRENDYVIEDKKIGGNAQSIALDTWIHHTSFLWDFDDKDMRYLAMPEKKPDYRGDRPHSSFITRLGPKLGAGLGDARRDAAERLAAELATELGEFYNVQDRLSSQDAEAVVSPDWQGRTKILDPATL